MSAPPGDRGRPGPAGWGGGVRDKDGQLGYHGTWEISLAIETRVFGQTKTLFEKNTCSSCLSFAYFQDMGYACLAIMQVAPAAPIQPIQTTKAVTNARIMFKSELHLVLPVAGVVCQLINEQDL